MGDYFFKQVYELVKRIPKGKVTTYGEIARALGTRDARKVGWALHRNKDPKLPCHRVVNKEGRLAAGFARHNAAPGFAFGGRKEQKRRLEAEGVNFVNQQQVDLSRYGYKFE